ncbi:MAG: PAS domain S-box protein [Syntrophales bacterium]
MDAATFLGLVQNAALLLAVAFIFDVVASRWRTEQSSFQQVTVGLAIGAIGITIMMTPWTFMPGIVFDTRSVLIGLSGLFFGSLSAAIAVIMTAIFRFYQGGIGAWTGIAVILTSGLIGIAWRRFRRRPLAEIAWWELYLFGMVVHLGMLGMMLTLPWATALRVLSNITLPVMLIYPLATALLGVLMVNRLRHKQVDDALRESEKRYRALIENAGDIMFKTDATGHFTFVNQAGRRIAGYDEQEVIGKEYWSLLRPDVREDAIKFFGRQFVKGQHNTYSEFPIISKDGHEIWLGQNTSLLVEDGVVSGFQATARDITDRKKAEEALQESEERFRTLSDKTPLGMSLVSVDGRYEYVNPAFVKIFGYDLFDIPTGMEWFRMAFPNPENRKKVIAAWKEDLNNYPNLEIRPRIYEVSCKGGGLRTILFRSVALPSGKQFIIYEDITDREQAEKQLKDTLESLRKAMGATTQVMAAAVEARDPYTAGHQIRSANLARAIATEMELPQDMIEGIRVAGSIHDIGKLSIPAEILSKPTKLSDLEFALIKEHARRGFEMLKDVESPWPLAEIVYQHHERIDGSGYPRNLKGEDICLEARILTVADVVEAMASHRPYRPGLGIDVALNEIEKNSGICYDSAVADACVRLFREKDFKLEEA